MEDYSVESKCGTDVHLNHICDKVDKKVDICDIKIPNGCITNHTVDQNGLINPVIGGARPKDTSKHHDSSDFTKCDHSADSSECECSPASSLPLESTPTVQEICESIEQVSLDSEQPPCDKKSGLKYVVYESEKQMPDIMRLITKDLSEPYSIYTYRYFIHNWPKLCFLAMEEEKCVGAIVCKLDMHKKMVRRGYIAMLAIDQDYRRRGIGSHLVMKAIRAMVEDDCDEVVLETEITNKAALHLYSNLGFVRDKRLFRYYLNGVDALRLKLWLR